MAIVSKTQLKSYFQTGDQPSQSNFDDFVDTVIALVDPTDVVIYPSGNVAVNDSTGVDSGYDFSVYGTSNFPGTSNFATASFTTALNAVNGNVGHLGGFTGSPTISVGSGLGVLPTLSINGSDLDGNIQMTSGTATVASSRLCTVTFDVPYASTPNVFVQAGNEATAILYGPSSVYATNVTTAGFDIWVATTPLAASTSYIVNYFVIF